jgi:hypothetical protein
VRPVGAVTVKQRCRSGGAATGQLGVRRRVEQVGRGQCLVDAGDGGGIEVDGTLLLPSYRFVVIGDPATISAALAIPGGVIDNVGQSGGRAVVTRRESVLVGALRPLDRPRYARPADKQSG